MQKRFEVRNVVANGEVQLGNCRSEHLPDEANILMENDLANQNARVSHFPRPLSVVLLLPRLRCSQSKSSMPFAISILTAKQQLDFPSPRKVM